MVTQRGKGIEDVVASIQKRWGAKALRRLKHVSQRTGISTGYTSLDTMLGTGGVPRGALTCLSGRFTSGKTSLALDVITQAQTEGEVTVYIDGAHTLDPETAEKRGVDLERLLIVMPDPPSLGLRIARDIIISGGAGIIVFDTGDGLPCTTETAFVLRRLHAALRQSPYALVCLSSEPSGQLVHEADVYLHLARKRWLSRQQHMTGYSVAVTVVRNRFATPGQTVSLSIALPEQMQRSGL